MGWREEDGESHTPGTSFQNPRRRQIQPQWVTLGPESVGSNLGGCADSLHTRRAKQPGARFLPSAPWATAFTLDSQLQIFFFFLFPFAAGQLGPHKLQSLPVSRLSAISLASVPETLHALPGAAPLPSACSIIRHRVLASARRPPTPPEGQVQGTGRPSCGPCSGEGRSERKSQWRVPALL